MMTRATLAALLLRRLREPLPAGGPGAAPVALKEPASPWLVGIFELRSLTR